MPMRTWGRARCSRRCEEFCRNLHGGWLVNRCDDLRMQIIEQTGFGVRSAVITLRRRVGGPVFLLFPMLHVASPGFYAEVQARLADCDVVVVEGVAGARVRVLTLAYRIAGRIRRSGLVLQSRALDIKALPGTIVRPDLSAKEFDTAWQRVSAPLRLLLYLLAPAVGLWMAIVGPRRALGKHIGMDDLPSARDEQLSNEEIDRLFLGSRDAALIKSLFDLADSLGAAPTKTVGVCWGAAHMPAVVRALNSRGFIPRAGEWLMATHRVGVRSPEPRDIYTPATRSPRCCRSESTRCPMSVNQARPSRGGHCVVSPVSGKPILRMRSAEKTTMISLPGTNTCSTSGH
jgi:hypothetical protein